MSRIGAAFCSGSGDGARPERPPESGGLTSLVWPLYAGSVCLRPTRSYCTRLAASTAGRYYCRSIPEMAFCSDEIGRSERVNLAPGVWFKSPERGRPHPARSHRAEGRGMRTTKPLHPHERLRIAVCWPSGGCVSASCLPCRHPASARRAAVDIPRQVRMMKLGRSTSVCPALVDQIARLGLLPHRPWAADAEKRFTGGRTGPWADAGCTAPCVTLPRPPSCRLPDVEEARQKKLSPGPYDDWSSCRTHLPPCSSADARPRGGCSVACP